MSRRAGVPKEWSTNYQPNYRRDTVTGFNPSLFATQNSMMGGRWKIGYSLVGRVVGRPIEWLSSGTRLAPQTLSTQLRAGQTGPYP
jgi:hypothetical protein